MIIPKLDLPSHITFCLDGNMGQEFSSDPPYIQFLLVISRLPNKLVP